MGDVSAVFVAPEAWEDASDLDRDEYRRRADELGVELSVEDPGEEGDGPVHLVVEGDIVAEDFTSTVPCPRGRRPWEHVVRRALDLDDPCLPGDERR